MIEILSSTATSFPTEVAYDDLLGLRYRTDGRGVDGTIDCLGVMLCLYRRAGVGIPDPITMGQKADVLHDYFEEVSSPDQVLDVAEMTRSGGHVWTVVRPGTMLSAKTRTGVYTQAAKLVAAIPGVRFWRMRDELLP